MGLCQALTVECDERRREGGRDGGRERSKGGWEGREGGREGEKTRERRGKELWQGLLTVILTEYTYTIASLTADL